METSLIQLLEKQRLHLDLISKAGIVNFVITIYFEYVAFFHAKLGSDIFPRVDKQTSGDTLQSFLDH